MGNPFEEISQESAPQESEDKPESRPQRRPGFLKRHLTALKVGAAMGAAGALHGQDLAAERKRLEDAINQSKARMELSQKELDEKRSIKEESGQKKERPAAPRPGEAARPRETLTDMKDKVNAHRLDLAYPGGALAREAEELSRRATDFIAEAERQKKALKDNFDKAKNAIGKDKSASAARASMERRFKDAVETIQARITRAKMAAVDAEVARGAGLARLAEETLEKAQGGKVEPRKKK